MKAIKTRVLNMNPLKGFLNLLVVTIIFIIVVGIGAGVKFGSRIPEMKQAIESIEQKDELSGKGLGDDRKNNGEHGREQDEDHEIDWENIISFTTSDYVFLGIAAAIFCILLGFYWLYTIAYVVLKSWKIGVNAWFFGVITLLTNVFGVALLWLYIGMNHICPECGKLQPRKANNCANCGSAIYVKCPDCGERISIKDQYCNGCGRKMNEKGKMK